ncbi:MAG TPA: hypothetical protein VG847_03550 [Chitinophagaceae bacterium]|nr:hypothetical protein [Chitinophagaceae bacterium]
MSTLLIATALIAVVAGICLLLISINNKQKRNAMNTFLNRLSQAGSSNNLSFSGQELLKDIAIGLDGLRRELLVLTRFKNGDYFDFTIDINNVQSCSVKKIYGFIKAGDLKNNRLEKHLEEIVLHLELYHAGSTDIPFYNHIDNRPGEAIDLENKARRWESMLNKLMNQRFDKKKSAQAIYYPSPHPGSKKKEITTAIEKQQ